MTDQDACSLPCSCTPSLPRSLSLVMIESKTAIMYDSMSVQLYRYVFTCID